MSANGTPQSYLNSQRQSSTPDTYRDRSMEQNNTSSGNPYGYVPQQNDISQFPNNRYIPPMWSQAGGGWMQTPTSYSLPSAYTPNSGGGLPAGPNTMSPSQLGTMPMWARPNFGGNPTDAYMNHPRGSMYGANSQYNTSQASNQSDPSSALAAYQGNAANATGIAGRNDNSAMSTYFAALQRALGVGGTPNAASGLGSQGAPQFPQTNLQASPNTVAGQSIGSGPSYVAPQYNDTQQVPQQTNYPMTNAMRDAFFGSNPGMYRRPSNV